jgi:putative Ca2+/H+ antiporter (TMEM165/GDT1 family)
MPDTTDTGEAAEGDEAPAPQMSLMERLFSPAPTVPAEPTLDRRGNPTKWSIDRLDGRERIYAYTAAVLAIVFAVIIYFEDHPAKHLAKGKSQLSPTTSLLLGVASGVALAVTTRIGRRALVGFVALFAFLSFGTVSTIVGLPFLILAVWLLYRSYKVQKAATVKLKEERAAGRGPAPAPRQTRAEMAAERRATRSGKKAPTGPEANKRYTPKKPTPVAPPPPKPSWRERRSTNASD